MDGKLALFAGAAFVGVLLAGAVALDSSAGGPGPTGTPSLDASIPLDSAAAPVSAASWPGDDDDDAEDDHDDDDDHENDRHDDDHEDDDD